VNTLFRRPTRKVILLLFALLLVIVGGLQVARVAAKARKHERFQNVLKDINYVTDGHDPFQTLDLYVPKHPIRTPIPVIVWVHGGAWVAGDKNHPPAAAIADRGFACVSINYRLSNQAPHPAQINDCKAAIRYVRAHAVEFQIDPTRIGVWGHSAGGHLSALLATSGDVKELEGEILGNKEQSSRVQAAAEWAGPTDLATCGQQAPKNCKIDFSSPSNPVAVLMGPNQSPVAYLAASPVQYVSKDDPPLLIVHAEDDDIVPVGQAKELDALYKRIGLAQRCHIANHGGHALSNPEFADETLRFLTDELSKN